MEAAQHPTTRTDKNQHARGHTHNSIIHIFRDAVHPICVFHVGFGEQLVPLPPHDRRHTTGEPVCTCTSFTLARAQNAHLHINTQINITRIAGFGIKSNSRRNVATALSRLVSASVRQSYTHFPISSHSSYTSSNSTSSSAMAVASGTPVGRLASVPCDYVLLATVRVPLASFTFTARAPVAHNSSSTVAHNSRHNARYSVVPLAAMLRTTTCTLSHHSGE